MNLKNCFVEFLQNYPPDNPIWHKELKHRIKGFDPENYHITYFREQAEDVFKIGLAPIAKSLEGQVYAIRGLAFDRGLKNGK